MDPNEREILSTAETKIARIIAQMRSPLDTSDIDVEDLNDFILGVADDLESALSRIQSLLEQKNTP